MTIRWKKVGGGGQIQKWTEAGQSLEGKWLGSHAGKFGELGDIETTEGRIVTFPMHTVLKDSLGEVKEGTVVRIVYQGTELSKAGRQFKAFNVYVSEDAADCPPSSAPEEGEREFALLPFPDEEGR